MAAQETVLEDEEIDSDEKCVGENDLKKLKDAHFKVMNPKIFFDILKSLFSALGVESFGSLVFCLPPGQGGGGGGGGGG
jgi:hypothetical protein